MRFSFIYLREFTDAADRIGLDDDALQKLESTIAENPQVGQVMQGTGGLRKVRIAVGSSGKSGGARVCYVVIVRASTVYFVTVFAKNEKSNLSATERQAARKWIAYLDSLHRSNKENP